MDISPLTFELIGRKALEHFALVLDPPQGRIARVPATNRLSAPPPLRSNGLVLLPTPHGLKVGGEIPNTEAPRAGIRRGDLAVSLNGEPARNWNSSRPRQTKPDTNAFGVAIVREHKVKALRLGTQTVVEQTGTGMNREAGWPVSRPADWTEVPETAEGARTARSLLAGRATST